MIAQFAVRLLLAVLFLVAAVFHLLKPRLLLPIMPPWVPAPLFCIFLSGVVELLGGIGLFVPNPTIQFFTGWGLVLLLIAIFPANIFMATRHIQVNGFPSKPWMGWARLPLQPVIIIAVMWVVHIWPFSAK